ncbi:hypothetical protein BIWAKO_03358 [Bosea sp. BIWAKO-01]|nr:hypothetical protein BIWAKO_03358 [Bosea sp. BIWAKO-01]
MTMASALIGAAAGLFERLIAERRYETNAIQAGMTSQGPEVVIRTRTSRRNAFPYFTRARNLVERLWCRFKYWWSIAPR